MRNFLNMYFFMAQYRLYNVAEILFCTGLQENCDGMENIITCGNRIRLLLANLFSSILVVALNFIKQLEFTRYKPQFQNLFTGQPLPLIILVL